MDNMCRAVDLMRAIIENLECSIVVSNSNLAGLHLHDLLGAQLNEALLGIPLAYRESKKSGQSVLPCEQKVKSRGGRVPTHLNESN